jgi:cytidine deaminase
MQSNEHELIEAALEVRAHAYAPYSQFRVGAALRTASGRLLVGCNVENASYGLTLCAERNAIFSMIAAGEREIDQLAVACAGGETPCGACRQVMYEFGWDYEVLVIDADCQQIEDSVRRRFRVSDLLPDAFRLEL